MKLFAKCFIVLVYQFDNAIVQQTKIMTKEIIELTQEERQKLAVQTLGYGTKSKLSKAAKVKYKTLERIAFVGRGEKCNIEKIRKHLLAAK